MTCTNLKEEEIKKDIDIDNVRSVDDQNCDTNTKNQQV